MLTALRSMRLIFVLGALLCSGIAAGEDAVQPTQAQLQFVQNKVIPLLTARCYKCHGDTGEARGSLRLTSRKAMLRGGDSGPSIVPGKADDSLLIEAVRYESFEMPPRSRLPEAEIAILSQWIADGAHWPKHLDAAPLPAVEEFPLEERRRSHWAWQPIESPSPPKLDNSNWATDDLDAFVLARLQAAGLSPAADADRYTLIRRLYFAIIGLPPSIAQIEAFVHDPASDAEAMATVVDRLLASKHFGERWGRHWLDLVRYAETLGHEFDYPLPYAEHYRDYVIRSLNADVGFDQWTREHIAGDLLSAPRTHPTEGYNESIIGTGFWFLNEDKHAPVDVKGEEASKIDNRIDVFSKTFLGLTVACARCHDHKFDAITTEDYYALSGFLQSSRQQTAWLDPGQRLRQRIARLVEAKQAAAAELTVHGAAGQSVVDIARYARAAMDVALPSPEEDDGSDGISLAVEQVAAARQCEPKLLQSWTSALAADSSRSLKSPLSLAATLAPAHDAAEEHKLIRNWTNRVLRTVDDTGAELFADFSAGLPDGWFTSGQAFSTTSEQQPFQLSCNKKGVRISTRGHMNSASLSHELHGTLASPTFELQHPELLVEVAGTGCRVRLVIDGYVMHEHNALLFKGAVQKIDTDGEYRWIRLAADVHRYQGHRMHLEFLDQGKGWFSVRQVLFAQKSQPPPPPRPSDFNRSLAQLLKTDDNSQTAEEVWAAHLTRHPAAFTAAMVNNNLYVETVRPSVSTALDSWKRLAKATPRPLPVLAITEGTPEDESVFIRGNHRNPGNIARRSFLTALRREDTEPELQGSGRLQLADRVVAADNPLTARVTVNRIWHHLLGRGIVESTDNFGVLGRVPTHPLLLDHLATQFRQQNWSIKAMIRSIVLSRTYRMASTDSPEAADVDPTNSLLHKFHIRRLEGEAIRDALLAVSGRLDRQMFGPPIPIHLSSFMQGRGRPKKSGPLDGNGRRSIYIAVRRNFLSPLMLAFDVPAPVSTMGKRTSSNVPAQALIMLNNEFVNQQAVLWADRLSDTEEATCQEVLKTAWYELLGRPPSAAELAPLIDFSGVAPEASSKSLSTEKLAEICHVLMNTKEFTFVR